jgi:hypothetical protein
MVFRPAAGPALSSGIRASAYDPAVINNISADWQQLAVGLLEQAAGSADSLL